MRGGLAQRPVSHGHAQSDGIRKQGRDCVKPIALSLSTYLTDFLDSQVMWNEQYKSIFLLLHNNSVLKKRKCGSRPKVAQQGL